MVLKNNLEHLITVGIPLKNVRQVNNGVQAVMGGHKFNNRPSFFYFYNVKVCTGII